MSFSVRLLTLICTIIYFAVIISLLRKKRLMLKYSMLWLLAGAVFMLIALFPQLLVFITSIAGIEVPSNGLFAMCIFFSVLILISLTVIVSEINMRFNTLVQKIAMMEKRIRELENSKDS